MSRVLVTGAAGFVGLALVRRLVADGADVLALGTPSSTMPTAPNLRWTSLDLLATDGPAIADLVRAEQISHCVHCAWYTNHADYLTAEVNRAWVAASLRLADGFSTGGGRRFVGLGSCLEYDQADPATQFSERSPLAPETLYARSKVALFERLATQAAGDDEFAWARLFFVYGPGDRANRLIPYILARLSADAPAQARFGGARRDYVHVDDLAGQIARIAFSNVGGALNTGTGHAVPVADIFEAAGALLGKVDLVQVNDLEPVGERHIIEADMTRFETAIGPLEARDIRAGLRDLIGH